MFFSRQMEQSLSSLAFSGSIVEAIAEAKRQQKLFVVYIAGDNPESKQLETSTWNDPNVSETLSKYCILLHILEGSSEALNFSAIYPQHCAPCITAVGYNGVKLWQQEGFVSADVVASSLEKAWLSLHVQAAFLTAALASGKQPASGTSEIASPQQAAHDQIQSADARRPLHAIDRNSFEDASKGPEADAKRDGVAFAEPSSSKVLDNAELDESDCKIETGNTSRDPVEIGQNNPSPVPEKSSGLSDNHPGSSNGASRGIVDGSGDVAPVNTEETREVEKANTSDSSANKSNDVFLNIRLPDGVSLQVKFSIMDTLKMVRDYIDENRTSSIGSFGIATPYPRKVFSNQDMDSTLSELGLLNRQALIVVPQNQNNSHSRGLSSQSQTYASDNAGSSNASGGYWASVKRLMSYVNPFSYLSSSTDSTSAAQESQSGIWQYGPNPSLQNTLRNGGIPSTHSPDQPDQSTATSGRNSKSKHQTSRFGANIHTLKHDNDDNRFSDRNAFWNGNSTQFGGNDDGK